MQKQRGKAWKKESHVSRQVDVRGVVPDHCNSQTLRWSASSLPNNELYWHCLSNVTVSSSWIRYCKKDLKILRWAPSLPYVTHVTLSTEPSSSVFAYCKQSKNWKLERPGNEITSLEARTAWERDHQSTCLVKHDKTLNKELLHNEQKRHKGQVAKFAEGTNIAAFHITNLERAWKVREGTHGWASTKNFYLTRRDLFPSVSISKVVRFHKTF